MEDYRTSCCEVNPIRKGRAHYICSECKDDVTMEMYYVSTLEIPN